MDRIKINYWLSTRNKMFFLYACVVIEKGSSFRLLLYFPNCLRINKITILKRLRNSSPVYQFHNGLPVVLFDPSIYRFKGTMILLIKIVENLFNLQSLKLKEVTNDKIVGWSIELFQLFLLCGILLVI